MSEHTATMEEESNSLVQWFKNASLFLQLAFTLLGAMFYSTFILMYVGDVIILPPNFVAICWIIIGLMVGILLIYTGILSLQKKQRAEKRKGRLAIGFGVDSFLLAVLGIVYTVQPQNNSPVTDTVDIAIIVLGIPLLGFLLYGMIRLAYNWQKKSQKAIEEQKKKSEANKEVLKPEVSHKEKRKAIIVLSIIVLFSLAIIGDLVLTFINFGQHWVNSNIFLMIFIAFTSAIGSINNFMSVSTAQEKAHEHGHQLAWYQISEFYTFLAWLMIAISVGIDSAGILFNSWHSPVLTAVTMVALAIFIVSIIISAIVKPHQEVVTQAAL